MATTDTFGRLVTQLSRLSTERRWEAHRDVEWDAPSMAVDAEDQRWELPGWEPIGGSDWYCDQAPGTRYSIGLHRAVSCMKVGIEFEGVLQQGLIAFASTLPNSDPTFRYVYHEISEEAQHTMMFQELVNRSGFDVAGVSEESRAPNETMVRIGRELPTLFFLCVLSGEEPIDHMQRRFLSAGPALHPLLHRIYQIHCWEEARHLSFARAYIRQAAPDLTAREIRRVQYQAPFLIDRMTRRMLGITDDLAHRWDMPEEVRDGIERGPLMDALRRTCTGGIVSLCGDLGFIPDRLRPTWVRLGL